MSDDMRSFHKMNYLTMPKNSSSVEITIDNSSPIQAYTGLPGSIDYEAVKEQTAGKKFDQGKAPISLIPSEAILGMARVLEFGKEKYGRAQWTKGIEYSRLIDAADRHMLAFKSGQDIDESGESHLLHAMVNLSFLYYFTIHNKSLDDRWEGK